MFVVLNDFATTTTGWKVERMNCLNKETSVDKRFCQQKPSTSIGFPIHSLAYSHRSRGSFCFTLSFVLMNTLMRKYKNILSLHYYLSEFLILRGLCHLTSR
eukprot:TRINITY_DN4183_c0_g2_i4.p2 TRINITY_DN4183_c0_g2~~TRINITY_DN4183_c0_g2_i4.p2  ORF type:complete len:101 (-),score=16.62 TRINITY_DN4183_c0_g2_i4:76-378(-)